MENEVIREIQNWLHSDTSYLSIRADYSRGYHDGVVRAKEIIAVILREAGIKETYPE